LWPILQVLASRHGFIFISGCAYPISRELREEARENLTFSSVFQDPRAYTGAIVIWGGTIISTLNRPAGTEVTVLKIPINVLKNPRRQ
jgi:starvation-inducible outer membrane lipoprotein